MVAPAPHRQGLRAYPPGKWAVLAASNNVSQPITGFSCVPDVVFGQPRTTAGPTESAMQTNKTNEATDQDRRRLLGMATIGIAAASAASLLPVQLVAATPAD